MTYEQNTINEAFERYLKTDLSEKTRAEIASHYDASIAEAFELIYRDALNCAVDSRNATMNAEWIKEKSLAVKS